MNRIPTVIVALALVAYGFAPCSADEASCQAEFKTVFMDKKGIENTIMSCWPSTDPPTSNAYTSSTMCSAQCRPHFEGQVTWCKDKVQNANLCQGGDGDAAYKITDRRTVSIKQVCDVILKINTDSSSCKIEKDREVECLAQFEKLDKNCSVVNWWAKDGTVFAYNESGVAGRNQICALDLEHKGCSALVEETAVECQKRTDGIESTLQKVCDVYAKVEATKKGLNYKQQICNMVTDTRRYTTSPPWRGYETPGVCPTAEQVEMLRVSACDSLYRGVSATRELGRWDVYEDGKSRKPHCSGEDEHERACDKSPKCEEAKEAVHAFCNVQSNGCYWNATENKAVDYWEQCHHLAGVKSNHSDHSCVKKETPPSPPPPSPPPTPPPTAAKKTLTTKLTITVTKAMDEAALKKSMVNAMRSKATGEKLVAEDDVTVKVSYGFSTLVGLTKAPTDDGAAMKAEFAKSFGVPAAQIAVVKVEVPARRRSLLAAHTAGPTPYLVTMETADFAAASALKAGAADKAAAAAKSSGGSVLETSITADVSYELKVAEDQATAVTAAVQSPNFGSDYANAVNAEAGVSVNVINAPKVVDPATPPPPPPVFFNDKKTPANSGASAAATALALVLAFAQLLNSA